MWLALFWLGVGIVAGEYVLYHLVLFLASLRRVTLTEPSEWPDVTVLIPTHNEAGTIAEKIANVLAADYPTDKLRIVVGDDGSEDDTVAIANGLGHANVTVRAFPDRRGKIAVQRDVWESIDSPIVLLTDATVRMPPTAMKQLVRHFADPQVGGVSARIRVANTRTNWLVELHRLLFQIQNAQKAGEGRLDSAGGLYGQLSAIRRDALGEFPTDVVYEDREFGIRLRERGYRVRVDDDAEADYLVPETVADFRAQKSRIAGAMTQSIARHRRLLFNPAYGLYGCVVFPEYALFRVLRQPVLLLAGLGLVVSALVHGFGTAVLHGASGAGVLLVSFWGGSLCLVPYVTDRAGYLRRLVTALPGVALLAAILAAGSLRYLRRGQSAAWTRIDRDTTHASHTDQS